MSIITQYGSTVPTAYSKETFHYEVKKKCSNNVMETSTTESGISSKNKPKSSYQLNKHLLKTFELAPSSENLNLIKGIITKWKEYSKKKIRSFEKHSVSSLDTFYASKLICKCLLIDEDTPSAIHVVKDKATHQVQAIAYTKQKILISKKDSTEIPCTEITYLFTNPKNIRSKVNKASSQIRGAGTKAVNSILKKSPNGAYIESLKEACSFYKKIGCIKLSKTDLSAHSSPMHLIPFWLTKDAFIKNQI